MHGGISASTGALAVGTLTGDLHVHHPAPRPATPTPHQLGAPPADFVGRSEQFAALDRALSLTAGPYAASPEAGGGQSGATAVISAINGAGGIGKTWLALAWAHRNLHHYPDGQLSADLRGFSPGEPRHAADVLADFLAALGVDRDHQPTQLDARVALYRTHTAGKRMLILLDNAATPDQVVPLLPGGTSCTVVITSRNQLRSLITRHNARPVHVDVLTDIEARALLTTALGDTTTNVGADLNQVSTELIDLCGRFPLALGLVAAHIRTRRDLLHDLVAELRDHGLDALDSGDPAASLPTVLSWSLDHLSNTQRTLFGLLGVAPGPDVTLPAVVSLSGLPLARARTALAALEEASLIERRPHGRYVMHDLVRDYAAATALDLLDDLRESALVRVLDFYMFTAHAADRLVDPHRQLIQPGPHALGVHPHPLPDAATAMAWLDAEHATLLAAQRTAVSLGRHHVVWHLARVLDTFSLRRGHLRHAVAAWRAALDAATHLADPALCRRAHRNLGRACSRLGLHEEATQQLELALTLAERHHDLTAQANTHRALASAWGARGEDRHALDHARHALDLHRALRQPVREADALNLVGRYAAHLGEFDTARESCSAALVLFRRHQNSAGEADTLKSLGFIAHHTGCYQQATEHYQQALAQFRSHGSSYGEADTLDSMGHPHSALGQHEQARVVWQQALKLYRTQGRDTDAQRVERQLRTLDTESRDLDGVNG